MDETLTGLRARIKHLRGARASILPTAVPIDRAIACAHSWVEGLSSMFNTNVLLRSLAAGKRPVEAYLMANTPDDERKLLAALFWLDGNAAKKKVERALRELYDREQYLTDDPGSRPTEIDAEVFQLEVSEERRIMELAAEGIHIPRRADASAEAVLAAAVDDVAAADSAAG